MGEDARAYARLVFDETARRVAFPAKARWENAAQSLRIAESALHIAYSVHHRVFTAKPAASQFSR
ncbi:MAG: hypothetical protein IN818_11390 [Cutibacterium sp.]|jgi:hypothetical protein|nr:hypothetical protein [Cutibacterium sp.]